MQDSVLFSTFGDATGTVKNRESYDMEQKLQEIASHFALEGRIAAIDSLGEGFINDTFIIRTEGEAPDYICLLYTSPSPRD